MEDNIFITVAGLIGAGKTTLTKYIGEYLDLPIYYEAVEENKILTKFYANHEKYSFTLQIDLLNRRKEQHHNIINNDKKGIMDRSIYEDQIFAKILHDNNEMNDEEYELYLKISNKEFYSLIKPTCIIFLDVKPEVALERIKMRARGIETGISLEYLQALYNGYINFIENISKDIFVIKVDWNKFRDLKELSIKIEQLIKTRKNIISI